MKVFRYCFCIGVLVVSCIQNPVLGEKYYLDQEQVTQLAQEGMFYFINNQGYKTAEKVFPGAIIKNNMDAVILFLEEAIKINKNRLDLHHGVAFSYLIKKNVGKALKVWSDILVINPKDFNATILYAVYSKVMGDIKTYDKYIAQAASIDLSKQTYYMKALERVDAINRIVLNTTFEKKYQDLEHAIIVLGDVLSADGTMSEQLIRRLQSAKSLAKLYPMSKIIVTGSVPRNGNTEAAVMKKWLIRQGVSSSNIIIEDKARDTIENSRYSLDILENLTKVKYVTLVTQAHHMRRVLNIFTEMALKRGVNITWDHLVAQDDPICSFENISLDEYIGIYRDFFRSSGISLYPGFFQ